MSLISCGICSTEFYAKPSHVQKGWGKYCSKVCQYAGQKNGQLYKCFICNKDTYRTPKDDLRSKSGNFFCSKSCQTIWRNSIVHIGQNHSNWNGGTASYRTILLKADVRQICGKCKTEDQRILAVHHKDRNRKNNSVSNLIWLCHNCHYLVHHYNNESEGFLTA